MAVSDYMHASNALVCILGMVSANPALGVAAGGLGAAFSLKDIYSRVTGQPRSLAERLAKDLEQELTQHHLPGQIRLLIPQMIEKANLRPAQVMQAARKPDDICALMLASLTDPAHQSPKAQDGFRRVVVALLARHLADPQVSESLRPAFEDAIAASLAHIGRQVETLVARADDNARRLGVQEGLLIALARRYVPDSPDSFESAYKSLELALETAARMQAQGALAHNTGQAADQIVALVADLNRQGKIDEADAAIELMLTSLADRAAALDAERAFIHTLSLDQARLRGDPDLAANRILAELARHPHPQGLFRALHDAWEEWYDRGKTQGAAFDLTVAQHLAQANLARSKGVQLIQARSDLALTLYERGDKQGRNDLLKRAIAHLREVAGATNPRSDAEFWCGAMSNLGMVLQKLGEREAGTARLDEAVKTYRQALARTDRNRDPLDWAMLQNNLGAALQILGERETGTARLDEAVTAYRAALVERTRDRVPLEWAVTQNNFGIALTRLGERETGTASLEDAATAFRAALEENTRDRVPLIWAITQDHLGSVLTTLSERGSGTAELEEAVSVRQLALQEQTRDRVPLAWAATQNNLGRSLLRLGERLGQRGPVDQAIVAFDAALLEHTRDRVPLDWAMSWGNRAEAMMVLADMTDDLPLARQALDHLQQAEAALREGGHDTFAKYSADRIPRAQALVGRLS